jgi:hypothetical protein
VNYLKFFPGCTFNLRYRTLAANDSPWRGIQTSPTPEVPFVVSGIPRQVLEVWSEIQSTAPASLQDPSPTSLLMFPLRLVKLRDIVLTRPFINEAKLVAAGHDQVVQDKARNMAFLQSVRKTAKGGTSKKRVVEENVRETRKAEEAARQRHDKVLEMQNELRLVTERQAPKTPASVQGDKSATMRSTSGISMSKSPLANARTVTSRSSKLNYLLKEA